MADPAVYRSKPFGGADLSPANEAALAEAKRLLDEGCAAVVALTHQFVADDRALAEGRGDLRLPLIIGGHEHTAMLLDVNGTSIVKAGAEASSAVVSELTWTSPGEPPSVTTRLEDVTKWPEDAAVRARVDLHMARVRELSSATLLKIKGEPLSSVGTRSRQTSMGTLICTRLRDALGADCCLFNGGGIRGSRTYPDRLTYGDIEAEVPFDNEVVVVPMKGRVIRDAVESSRAKLPAESGAFLQVDDRMTVEGTEVVAIDGAPIDLEREYSVAIVRELLLGLDRIEPLVRWAEENPKLVPPADSGREPKVLLVQSFAVELWRELGGFDALDTDGDDRITASEIAEAVMRVRPSQAPSPVLAELVVRAVDADADHVISREDAEALHAAEARRRAKVEDPT
jgi:2',3'-cyclic-nucleotide 2'-phosphodiesterase (5'-nucleotidase family)